MGERDRRRKKNRIRSKVIKLEKFRLLQRSSRSSGRVRTTGRTAGYQRGLALQNLKGSDSTSLSEDDSTGMQSWGRDSARNEPIYNTVPEEDVDEQRRREVQISSRDDITVPTYSRSLCTPVTKRKLELFESNSTRSR